MVYRHGPERIDCYALFDGKNGQLINTSINRQFYTAEIGSSFEFHKRKYTERNKKLKFLNVHKMYHIFVFTLNITTLKV